MRQTHQGSAAVENGPPPPGVRGPVPNVLALQSAAGNRATSQLLSLQPCGPRACDCSAEERARYDAENASMETVQRDGPAADPADIPAGSQYAALEPDMKALLQRTFTAHAYPPFNTHRTLVSALDSMGAENINILV